MVRPSPGGLEEYARIVRRFEGISIIVVGDLMVDEYVWGEVSRVSQEAPVPVVSIKRRSFRLGGACNVANNIGALGGRAIPVGVVGKDLRSELLRRMLSQQGITTEGLVEDESRCTTTKTRVIARGQQIVRCDEESTEEVSGEQLERIVDYVRENIASADAVIIEDYGKGVINPAVTTEVLALAKSAGKLVAVDPKDEHFLMYKGVTVMTPNQNEVATFWGKRIRGEEELVRAAKSLLKQTQAGAVLVTRGEHGMLLVSPDNTPVSIQTVAREVYDVTGAGDTVIAVMALALCAGASIEQAARLANQAAGIVVTEIGAATVTPDELVGSLGAGGEIGG